MTDKKAKILEKIKALLAKADSTTFPEEADAFRAKADELMTAYTIEAWQLDTGQETEARKPEVREMDFAWWRDSNRSDELWSLFLRVAGHTRVVVALRGYGHSGSYRTMPIIGLSSDLDYFDLLFTHLMLQMGKQLEPKPVESLSLEENAYNLRAAGMDRFRACKLLWEGGYVVLGDEAMDRHDITTFDAWEALPAAAQKAVRAKVRTAAERWAKKNGLTGTTRTHPATYQRSFAMGFVDEVGKRFREMRAQQEAHDQTGSMALVVRDIYEVSKSLYDEMWPQPESTGKRSKGRSVIKEVRVDDRAYNVGRTAGRNASLQADPSKGVKHADRKGLNR
jgi:hypothetical protein